MVHGLRELTDPGVNWEKRMEKPGVEREAGGRSKLLWALWVWGRLSTELSPSSAPVNASVPGALFCSHAGLGSEVSAH